jgi:3-oxoacyl-[acyl-carrier-protein] synthase III
VRISNFGVHLPGQPIRLDSLALDPEERERLPKLGQELTFISTENSTELMIHAGRDALSRSKRRPEDIRMVISAPSLITAYGLEIPAIAVRGALGLSNAECVNIAQGCTGVLRGIQLAAQMLSSEPEGGDIMVVTSCRASTLTRHLNHGAFFWGDGSAAVILTADPGPGLRICGYAERAAEENWDCMRIDFGDAQQCNQGPGQQRESLINVRFANADAQHSYIRREPELFAAVLNQLLARQSLQLTDIEGLVLPSTGLNRVPLLLSAHRALRSKLRTDFRMAHLGGVDALLALRDCVERGKVKDGAWLVVLSPAFTAQWGGLLLQHRAS